MKPTQIIEQVMQGLLNGNGDAGALLEREYPFREIEGKRTGFTVRQKMKVFMRDRFVDRYSGQRLLFPGVLRVLHLLLPEQVPYHRNWKMSETHPMFWELYPTVDHVVPVARGGDAGEDNLVTTSQLRNSAKANWTLEELGWSVHPPGRMVDWDGLMGVCRRLCEQQPVLLEDRTLGAWLGG